MITVILIISIQFFLINVLFYIDARIHIEYPSLFKDKDTFEYLTEYFKNGKDIDVKAFGPWHQSYCMPISKVDAYIFTFLYIIPGLIILTKKIET